MTGTVVLGQLTQRRRQQQRRLRNYMHVFPLLDISLLVPMQSRDEQLEG